jgi:hypothetical protein
MTTFAFSGNFAIARGSELRPRGRIVFRARRERISFLNRRKAQGGVDHRRAFSTHSGAKYAAPRRGMAKIARFGVEKP